MTSFLADTCRAAIDALAEYVGRDAAEMTVFCKIRPRMLVNRRDPKGHLHVSIVDEVNPLFGGMVNRLNCDYEDSKEAAKKKAKEEAEKKAKDDDDQKAKKKAKRSGDDDDEDDEDWIPPEFCAPHWDTNLSAVQRHNQAMADLRVQILADWKEEHQQHDMKPTQLKAYMAGMAANTVDTEGDLKNCFNGKVNNLPTRKGNKVRRR